MQILKQEGKSDGFEEQGMQRRRNGCMRKTQRWETQEKVEEEVQGKS